MFRCFTVILLLLCSLQVRAEVEQTARSLVENQRRILILRDAGEGVEQSAGHIKAEAHRAGVYLFFVNQHLAKALHQEILADPSQQVSEYERLTTVMDDPAYFPEDRLVFRGVLESMAPFLPQEQQADANQRLEELKALRTSLGREFDQALQMPPVGKSLGKFIKGKMAASESWGNYLERITALESPQQILEALDQDRVAEYGQEEPTAEAIARGRFFEWDGEALPEKVILLTFDDGPHSVHTPAILDILKANQIRAVFFQLGVNLGTVSAGKPSPGHHADIQERLVAEGHAVGNHSFSHPVLTKLTDEAISREISDTQALLEVMVPQQNSRTGGFRPPYGARNDRVMAQIDRHGLRSVVWNIDSEDWADPIPASIAHRVAEEAERYGRGIVLMHDIHGRTVDALPLVIDALKKRDFKFAYWDGKRITVDVSVVPAVEDGVENKGGSQEERPLAVDSVPH